MTEALVQQRGELSVQAVVDRKRKLVEVMDAVMREGEHYGRIPGCGNKPALFKSGAEVLATTFGLAPRFKLVRTDHPGGHREYEVTCRLVHVASGNVVAEGLGSCSTLESKYRWRRGERVCPACGKAGTVIKGRADFGGGWLCFAKKDGCGAKWPDGAAEIETQSVDRVENPDIADTYNTVLKMGKKRALVDATLTAVGASDILIQDLEDLPPGSRASEEPEVEYGWEAVPVQPSSTSAPPRRQDPPPPPSQRTPPESDPPRHQQTRQRSDVGSGDVAWDELLEAVAALASIDTSGWLPADLLEEWDRRIAAPRTKPALNAFAPWISEAGKRAGRSKNCAEVAARMSASFNAKSAELGRAARGS